MRTCELRCFTFRSGCSLPRVHLLEVDLVASFNPWTHSARVSAAVALAHSWRTVKTNLEIVEWKLKRTLDHDPWCFHTFPKLASPLSPCSWSSERKKPWYWANLKKVTCTQIQKHQPTGGRKEVHMSPASLNHSLEARNCWDPISSKGGVRSWEETRSWLPPRTCTGYPIYLTNIGTHIKNTYTAENLTASAVKGPSLPISHTAFSLIHSDSRGPCAQKMFGCQFFFKRNQNPINSMSSKVSPWNPKTFLNKR